MAQGLSVTESAKKPGDIVRYHNQVYLSLNSGQEAQELATGLFRL